MWHWLVVTFASWADWAAQTYDKTTSGLQSFGGWAFNATISIPNHLQPGFGGDDYAKIIYWTNANYCEHFQVDCGLRQKRVTHVTVNILDTFNNPITRAAKLPSQIPPSVSALASFHPLHVRPTTSPSPSTSQHIPSVTTTLIQDTFTGSKPARPSPANRPPLNNLPRCTNYVAESRDVPTSSSQPDLNDTQHLLPPILAFSTTTLCIAITATASLLFSSLCTILWVYRHARATDAATAESLNRADKFEAENGRIRAAWELTVQEKDQATKRADTAEKERDALRLQLAEKQDIALQQTARADEADRQRKGIWSRAVRNSRAFKVASVCLSWLNEQRISSDVTISRLQSQQRVDQSDINVKKTVLKLKQKRIDDLEAASKSQEESTMRDAEMASEIVDLKNQLQSKDHTITETGAMMTRLQKTIEDKDVKINQHRNTINEHATEIKQHRDTIKSQGKAIAGNASRKSDVDTQTALASKLRDEGKEKDKTITDQNVTINSQSSSITQLQFQVDTANESVKTQERTIKDKDALMSNLQGQLRSTQTRSEAWKDAHAKLAIASDAKDEQIKKQAATMMEKNERVAELEKRKKSKEEELSQLKDEKVSSGIRDKAREATINRQRGENERLQREKQDADTKLQQKVTELEQANRTIEDKQQAVSSTPKKNETCTQGTQTEVSPVVSYVITWSDFGRIDRVTDCRTTPIAILRSTAIPPSKNDGATILPGEFKRVQRGINHLAHGQTIGGQNDEKSLATLLSMVPDPSSFPMPAIEAAEAAAVSLGNDLLCLRPFERLELSKTMGFTVLPTEKRNTKKLRAKKDANKAKGRKDCTVSTATPSVVASPSPSTAPAAPPATPKPENDLLKSKWAS